MGYGITDASGKQCAITPWKNSWAATVNKERHPNRDACQMYLDGELYESRVSPTRARQILRLLNPGARNILSVYQATGNVDHPYENVAFRVGDSIEFKGAWEQECNRIDDPTEGVLLMIERRN